MIAPLDVFAIDDSDSQWLGCAGTLLEALELIEKIGPGAYLVFSQTTRHKHLYEVTPRGNVSLIGRSEVGDSELSV